MEVNGKSYWAALTALALKHLIGVFIAALPVAVILGAIRSANGALLGFFAALMAVASSIAHGLVINAYAGLDGFLLLVTAKDHIVVLLTLPLLASAIDRAAFNK